MKRVLLLFCLIPCFVFSQIASISTTGKQSEHVGKFLIHYLATDSYDLTLHSEYDPIDVRVSLGVGPTEAARSLANLHEVIYNEGQTFVLQGENFEIGHNEICATNGACISSKQLRTEIEMLITDYGADFGDLSIILADAKTGSYMISFDIYGFLDIVRVGVDISARMSRDYKENETISISDVRILRDAIVENYMSVYNNSLAHMICNVIIGEF